MAWWMPNNRNKKNVEALRSSLVSREDLERIQMLGTSLGYHRTDCVGRLAVSVGVTDSSTTIMQPKSMIP